MTNNGEGFGFKVWLILGALLCVAAIIRFGMVRAYGVPYLTPDRDDSQYVGLGRALCTKGVFEDPSRPNELSADRAPLFPAFIAMTDWTGRGTPSSSISWQAFLSVMVVAFVFFAGTAVAGPAAGLLAAAFSVWDYVQVHFIHLLQIESFYTFLLGWVCVFLARWGMRPDYKSTVLLGLSIGVSLSCRSALLLLPFLLAARFLVTRGSGWYKKIFLLLFCAYAPLLPWVVRNYKHFGEFVPFERSVGYLVIYSASMGYDQGLFGITITRMAEEQIRREGLALGNYNEDVNIYKKLALINIKAHPVDYAAGCARRFGEMFGVLRFIFPRYLLVMASLGLALGLLCWNGAVLWLGVFILYFLGMHSLMSICGRYFVPLAPVLCILAGAGIAIPLSRLRAANVSGIPSFGQFARLVLSVPVFIFCVSSVFIINETLSFSLSRNEVDAFAVSERMLNASSFFKKEEVQSGFVGGKNDRKSSRPSEKLLASGIKKDEAGDGKDAVKSFSGALHYVSGSLNAGSSRASALFLRGDYAGAEVLPEEKVCAEPSARAEELVTAGIKKYEAGDRKGAVKSFRQAVSLAPGSSNAGVSLASALSLRGDYAGAEKVFAVLLRETVSCSANMKGLVWIGMHGGDVRLAPVKDRERIRVTAEKLALILENRAGIRKLAGNKQGAARDAALAASVRSSVSASGKTRF